MTDPAGAEATGPARPSQDPTGELPPGFGEVDAGDLRALAEAGWGEGDDDDPHVPGDFLATWVAQEAEQAKQAGLEAEQAVPEARAVADIGRGVRLVTRPEWRARPPRSTSRIDPTFGTTAHWEGPHMGWPWAHGTCASLVRGIQAYHMDRQGWSDIAYTAVACGHAFVFEGRWIGRRTAANGTNPGNSRAYAVCYLGGEGDPFTDDGRRAMRAAMDYLDARGGAGPGRNGHRDWKATACPGDVIYRWVHSGQPAEEDEMDIADLRRELTTGGTPTRSAIRDLVRLGTRDALATPGDPARTGVLEVIRRALAEDDETRAEVISLVRRALREEGGT